MRTRSAFGLFGALIGFGWAFVWILLNVRCEGDLCVNPILGEVMLCTTGVVAGAAVGLVTGAAVEHFLPNYRIRRFRTLPREG